MLGTKKTTKTTKTTKSKDKKNKKINKKITKTIEFEGSEKEVQQRIDKMYYDSCLNGNLEFMEILYKLGANPEGYNENILFDYIFKVMESRHDSDSSSSDVPSYIFYKTSKSIIKLLLNNGLNVRKKYKNDESNIYSEYEGKTALFVLSVINMHSHVEIIEEYYQK